MGGGSEHSTQVLAPGIELQRLTPCTQVTAKPLDLKPWPQEISKLTEAEWQARDKAIAASEYVRQQEGLVTPLKDRWSQLLQGREGEVIFDCSDGHVLASLCLSHGLLASIEMAYSQHLHLHLRPDDVWLTICQGVSRHLQHGNNAELYRKVFVNHEGQEDIVIEGDSYRTGDSRLLDWPSVVAHLTKEVTARVAPGACDVLQNDFSTTDAISKTASQIVLMDVMKQYFRYIVLLRCGIPQVTLHGSLEDWQRLLKKARVLRDMGIGLDWWLDRLIPVLEQLVRTYEGAVDSEWWGQVLTRTSFGSGKSSIGGWVRFFFPYAVGGQPVNFDSGNGLDDADVPTGFVNCPFILNDIGTKHRCQLVAGTPGVAITEDGGVAPCMGWLVRKVLEEKEPSPQVEEAHFTPTIHKSGKPEGRANGLMRVLKSLLRSKKLYHR